MKKIFSGQQDGEKVITIFRRHYLAISRPMAVGTLMITVGIILISLTMTQLINAMFGEIVGNIILLVGLIIVGNALLKWYYTFYILTDQRIRQQVQYGIFKKRVVDVQLTKVQNVRYSIKGIIGSWLEIGNIALQTATGDLIMTKIGHVEDVYNQILDQVSRYNDLSDRQISGIIDIEQDGNEYEQ